jgi:cytochrome P450
MQKSDQPDQSPRFWRAKPPDNTNTADAWSMPLADIDVSRAEWLWRRQRRQYQRMRQEDPVHYCRESPNGPYWSVTRYADIKTVDTGNLIICPKRAASRSAIRIPSKRSNRQFISMDELRHSLQRKTVAPSVAPQKSDVARTADPRTCRRHSGQSAGW